MYAVRCTRPDVAFAQNITSRFQQNPGDLHWTTVKNILKYLRNTKDMFLVYGGDLKRELRVSCYTDAGYLTDADDLKSQTGYEVQAGVYFWPLDASKGSRMGLGNSFLWLGARHFPVPKFTYRPRSLLEFGDVNVIKSSHIRQLSLNIYKSISFSKASSELTRKWNASHPASSFIFWGCYNFIDRYRQLRIALSIEDKLNYLEQPLPPAPVAPEVSLILIGLRKEFDGFVQNYNMHSLGKTVNELHAMLKLHEQILPKNCAPALHAIRAEKGKNKLAYAPKPKIPPPPKREDPAKDSICHECGETGHWKRNCLQYLVELLKKKKNAASRASGSGIFTIELNTFLNRSWIYDTGCGTYICNTTQGLRESRKLKPGALSLYVGNGQREAVESIGLFYLYGFIIRFVNNTIQVSRNNMVYFSAIPRDGIFEIDLSNSYANESSIYTVSNKRAKLDLDSALLWHCRLGHISKKRIEKLQHDGLLNSTDLRAFEKCVPCMSGKMARKPYTHQVERAKDLLGLIHTDVCGPFKIMSRQGASYFVTFTDDFSRYGYVYLLKHKHEVFETFKVFQKEVENQLGKTIKSLRSDRGGEYMSQEFLDHLKDHGLSPTYSPYTHTQHNVWGCEAIVKRDTLTKPDKLEPMSIKCIFIGYPKETMGYSFYYPPENKVLVARNAEFLENSLITQEASGSLEDLEIIQEEDTHPSIDTSLNHKEDDLEIDEPQSDINPIRRSTRRRHPIDRLCLYIDAREHELGDLGEPANYKAALLDPESDKWLNAMNVEMQSMKDNEVWDLVDLPPNGKTVGSKWLFKKKTDMDGAVHTYKARLVAKGYTQTPRIDYEETFSPVADIRAIRILIAIAAFYDYEIWQMDVKTAFLNGYLSEEVYMEQPEGFVNPKYPNRVCKLKRSIYGLKQASRQWNKRFDDEIKKFGFTQNRDEPCVYLKASRSNVTFLILYVDDILIMGNNIPMLQDVKSYLGRCFAMKDLGEAAYILGIKIYRDRSRRLIDKLTLSKSQGASTLAKLKHMQNVPYTSAVGSNMYAVRCTRPDVAFAKNITSRFQQNPVYGGDLKRELRVSCYTDTGYLMDADDLKSHTRYVFILNRGAIDWKSAKQSIFATSYEEAKYITAYDASKEAVWVRKFISGLGVVPTIEEPISMYCDNTEAITIANESGITKGARHFRAKVNYLREVFEFGDIKLEKVHTYDNLVDPFTKALAFPKHSEHTRNIGMLPASSLM
ncbi:retrotransposon protein, putative, ty1-copia subclass [Tanacetum coccineum]|uniref:Retrotransposon protein, putative, ty1-copia subclass n=1 Tax=Tanacetum coccineum TaxID=301880 RepID=A0ABQ5F3M4_9ASTR